jgi:plastocyanin
MRLHRSFRPLALVALVLATGALAQSRTRSTRAPAASSSSSAPATQADIARLQKQLDEQRVLMLRMLQADRDRIDALIQAMGGEGRPGAASSASALPAAELLSDKSQAARRAGRPGGRSGPSGSVSGTVTVRGGTLENAVIYVETVRDGLARGRHEIRQLNKQFSPRFSVVPRGTTVSFPNQDNIFHNVFSLSPGNTFDLGTYRSGDKPGEVSLNSPGVVQVFCNLHSQMSASVLVTPSRLYTLVDKNGSFQLDNIPVGKHRLVAWMPKASEPMKQEVEITSEGASQVSFNLTARATDGAHTNKHGQPYGSYQE